MSDLILGKKPIEAKQVKEEEGGDNALYKFSYSQYVKDELSKSMGSESKIPGLPADLLGQSSVSGSQVAEKAVRLLLPLTRLLVFVLFVGLLYSWNLALFRFGDFQMIDYAEEKCSEVNRFDFRHDAWQEEIITSNMNNLKAKYQSDKNQENVKHKIEKLQSILNKRQTQGSEDETQSFHSSN
jgi:hypothetical protein